MKKGFWIIIIVAVVVVVAVTTTVSLALWTKNEHDSIMVKTDIVDENPSLKYQMYVPVKETGNGTTSTTSAYARVGGSFAVSNGYYSYTLTDASELSSIVGFALIGWYGGVALERCEIPGTVTVQVNGNALTKPVVRIMSPTSSEYDKYAFTGDKTVITDLIIGNHVVEIDAGVFSAMDYLERLTLVGNDDTIEEGDPNYLYMRPYSFGGCNHLATVVDERNRDEEWDYSMVFADSRVLE